MKLIVEEFNYESDKAKEIISDFSHSVNKNGSLSTDCVGYCYSKSLDDCIFFVPKVICNSENKILGKCSPEDCIDLESCDLTSEQKAFIRELNVWIYRSLKVYSEDVRKKEESSKILLQKYSREFDNAGSVTGGTFVDKILALIKFYNENRDFFIFTMRSIHSQMHKISWNKTVSRSQVFFQDDIPVYMNPISKKKAINWEEELMVIFFSILEDVKKYGFDIRTENNYELIKGDAFEAYKAGLGTSKLLHIKHRYFSDKTRKLWALCYAFFEAVDTIRSSKDYSDYLIATNYHVAFESMVDELIGDPELDEMKKLDDGKIIDHIYRDVSLLSGDLIYYIGDSKYYQVGCSLNDKSNSVYKQYTYARNIVHDSITRSLEDTWPFRDPLTEGYVITPNFFISAEIDPEMEFGTDGFEKKSAVGKEHRSMQFDNRLFDRDTLWINHYNLNFLYLLSTYASDASSQKRSFREKARRFFREQTIILLNSKYVFWELKPKGNNKLKDILNDDLQWCLRGLVYRFGKDGESLLLALEKPTEPERESERPLWSGDKLQDFDRLKKIIQPIFAHRRCALVNKEGQCIDYVDVSELPESELKFYLFDDEIELVNG